MSELGARYSRLPNGCLDLPVSKEAQWLLGRIWTSTRRDVCAGLIRVGPAGLAEEVGCTVTKVRRLLKQLAGYLLVDDRALVMFILGAIHHDPPRNPKQIAALARQFAQIPRCAPVAAAAAEVEAAIARLRSDDRNSLLQMWRELNSHANCSGQSLETVGETVSAPIPIPIPIPIPTQIPTPTPGARRASAQRRAARATLSLPDKANGKSKEEKLREAVAWVLHEWPRAGSDYLIDAVMNIHPGQFTNEEIRDALHDRRVEERAS